MPARKPTITLARTAGPQQHDEHVMDMLDLARRKVMAARRGAPLVAEAMKARQATAAAALNSFQRGVSSMGHRMPDTPTAERLMQAMGEASVSVGVDSVVIYDENNEPIVERHPVVRTRIGDCTMDILAKRRLLSRDPERNAAYHRAGRRLHGDWHSAGLSSIGSIDFDRDGAKGSAPRLFRSEAQVDAFNAYFEAMVSLTPDERSIVTAIVIEELPLPMAGQKMLAYKGQKQAQAAALALLRNALYRLDWHYHMAEEDKTIRSRSPVPA